MKQVWLKITIFLLFAVCLLGLERRYFKTNETDIMERYYYSQFYRDMNNSKSSEGVVNAALDFSETISSEKLANEQEWLQTFLADDGKISQKIDVRDFSETMPIVGSSREQWAKYFYKLGIYLYNHDQKLVSEYFLASAVRAAPYWSYFWIELGNYYSSMGEVEKSIEVSRSCLDSPYIRGHCSEYFNGKGGIRAKYLVGFLEEEINKNVK